MGWRPLAAPLDWWRSLEDSVDLRPSTWENFKIELENTFQTINPVETARNKLALLEQVTTVRQYATQFRSTALLIPGITDEEKMDRFIRGLKLEVQKETRFKTPKSFDEAVQIAERYEGVTYQVQMPRTNNNRFNRANRYADGGASTSSTSTNYSSAAAPAPAATLQLRFTPD
ncbi:putative retrotransposon protein [Chlorella sorokiniana]|uniref:Retrotransposon protein n=1 Tax=Chlorella sorokiniana TaxID=3076 RepID=A0A2P6TQK5_CHLSO|nr:putative retrotransposon protein [Chlorella sorokiniana]|eukprot:PRW56319.1 putative retrotransposon protein [Chlorella sorokiniana]